MSTIRYSEGELPREMLTANEVNKRECPVGTTLKDRDGDYWFTSGIGDWHCLDPDEIFQGVPNAHEPYEIISPAQDNEPPVCNCGISQADLKKLFESNTDKEAIARLKSYAGIATPQEGEVWVVRKKDEPGEMVLGYSEGYFSHFKDSPVFYITQELTLIKRLWPEEQ